MERTLLVGQCLPARCVGSSSAAWSSSCGPLHSLLWSPACPATLLEIQDVGFHRFVSLTSTFSLKCQNKKHRRHWIGIFSTANILSETLGVET